MKTILPLFVLISTTTGTSTELLGYCLGGVCPGTQSGTIISPNHPANYPAKSSVKYILETNYGSKIKLYFGDNFKIEKGEFNSTSCEYDSVKLYDSDGSVMETFCGDTVPPFSYVSVANKMTVEFTSDVDTEMAGFIAYWDRVPPNGTVSGYIQSPGYPNKYEDCSYKRWVLQAQKGSKIRIDFLDFQTERYYDRLLLADGIPKRSDLGSLFNIDPDDPICQVDYSYAYDYSYDYYDYYDYYRDDDDDENKTVKKQNTRYKQSKRKEQESGDHNRGLVSKYSKIGNQGIKQLNLNTKKTITNKKNQKRKGNKNNQKNKMSKGNVSQGKGNKMVEAKRVLNKKKQTKGSKQDKRRKIRENGGKPDGKPRKPGEKPGGKPDKENSRIPDLGRNFEPDQIIAELSGTLSNYTYISKSNTMSIFWASDTSSTRKGFKAVYNIIEG